MSKVKQLFEAGETVKIKGEEFEVITVSVRSESEDSKPAGYQYEFILKSEADAIRKKNELTAIEDEKRAEARALAEAERKALLTAELPSEQ